MHAGKQYQNSLCKPSHNCIKIKNSGLRKRHAILPLSIYIILHYKGQSLEITWSYYNYTSFLQEQEQSKRRKAETHNVQINCVLVLWNKSELEPLSDHLCLEKKHGQNYEGLNSGGMEIGRAIFKVEQCTNL